jgi:Outer membrane protein beta-barrel domain
LRGIVYSYNFAPNLILSPPFIYVIDKIKYSKITILQILLSNHVNPLLMYFKTLATAVALFFVCQQTLLAQDSFTGAVTFGTSYSSLRTDLFAVQNARMGFSAGLSFVVPLNDRLEFNPEISFIQKGGSARATLLFPEQISSARTYNFNYNSFEASMLLGIKPLSGLPVRFQTGAFFGAISNNLSDKITDLYVGDVQGYNKAIPVENLNNAFAGIDFGPVASISVGNGRFRANLRYQMGIPNLYNRLEFMPEKHSIRTSAARLTMTYFLF